MRRSAETISCNYAAGVPSCETESDRDVQSHRIPSFGDAKLRAVLPTFDGADTSLDLRLLDRTRRETEIVFSEKLQYAVLAAQRTLSSVAPSTAARYPDGLLGDGMRPRVSDANLIQRDECSAQLLSCPGINNGIPSLCPTKMS